MSWIQENKFAAALAGVTLVGSVALITLTSQKGGEFDAAAAKLKKAHKQEAELLAVTPFPNKANLEAKKASVAAYAASAEKLQESFLAYRPTAEQLADVDPTSFSNMMSGYVSRLNAKFKDAGTQVPDAPSFGFEAYASKPPRAEATGELSYEMKAFEWLFTTLAENSPEALINVVRPKLAIESDAPKVASKSKSKSKSKKSKKGKKGFKGSGRLVKGEPIYDAMPLEFSFRCTEAQLKSFLEDIANSPKYFMAVRALRVQNERLTAPNVGDVKFPSSNDDFMGAGGMGDFIMDEEPIADDAVAADAGEELPKVASDSDEALLLAQILGAEKLNVFVKLDLLVFKPGQEEEKSN